MFTSVKFYKIFGDIMGDAPFDTLRCSGSGAFLSVYCDEIKTLAPSLPELALHWACRNVEGGFLIRTVGWYHRVSFHPVLLQVVPSGLCGRAQIIALGARGNAPMCKSIGQSETESYGDGENRVRRFLISEFGSCRAIKNRGT